MTRNKAFILFSAVCFLLFSAKGYAQKKNSDNIDDNEQFFESGALVITNDSTPTDLNVIFPEKSKNLALSHFTWGADFGSSIDMSSHNMSTFDLDVNLGYKNAFIKMIGVGAGIHRSIRSGDNYIPVYIVFRSSFRKKPSLCFLNLQVGYSFNTIRNAPLFGDFASSLGLGINLMQSRRAKSFMIIGLGNRHFNKNHKSLINVSTKNVLVAKIQIGIHF